MSVPYTALILTPADEAGVAFVTLNRPKQLNAFNRAMADEIVRAFDELSVCPKTKVIVFRGNGRIWCAGADLQGFGEPVRDAQGRILDEGGLCSLAINRCRKPTIVAIHGGAVGVGITMTLPATIRIASSTAKIAFPFLKRGITQEATSTFWLPRLIGMSKAMRLVATGETVLAGDEKVRDLFEIVENGDQAAVWKRAEDIARGIARDVAPRALLVARRTLTQGADSPEEANLWESKVLARLRTSADAREGGVSFLEKRAPRFEVPGVEEDLIADVAREIEEDRKREGKGASKL